MLARSVYHTFMEGEDGHIYLKPNFRPTVNEPKIHIDPVLIRDFQDIAGILDGISTRLDTQYGVDSKNSTFLSIKKSIAIFQSFAKILDYESYSEYVKLPYAVDATSETILPIYTTGGTILASDPLLQVTPQGTDVVIDPAVTTIIGIL